MYSNGPPHIAEQKQDDQLEHTYSSYVRIRDLALKTYLRRWTIGKSGERGSGISVLAARHDDDDDDDTTVHVKDEIIGNVFGGTCSDSFGLNFSPHTHCEGILQSTSRQMWDFFAFLLKLFTDPVIWNLCT